MTIEEKPRFSEPLAEILPRVRYRRVAAEDLLDPIYRLRYEAYRRENFIPVNAEELCVDDLDAAPNVMSFGVYIDDMLVSSLRIHHLTPDHRYSPSMLACPEVLTPMLDDGLTFMDPSRFTIDKEATLALPALPFVTLRLGTMAAQYFEVDYSLSLVRPEHAAFYRRVFLSKQMSDVRSYPGLAFPVCLYGTHLPSVAGPVGQRYPIFRSLPEEREMLFGSVRQDGEYPLVAPTAVEADARLQGSHVPA